jgi:hypothetical protein
MIGHKVWTGLAVMAALAVSAGLASASAPVPRTKATHASAVHTANASAAVHTATPLGHRVHRHHHAPGAVLAANRLAPVPASAPPERPAPPHQRPHRATLPALAQGTRHAPNSRYGPRHAPATLADNAAGILATRPLDARPESTPDPRILTVTGGRGPPRGSPSGPSRGRATPAPASAVDADACSAAFPVAALPTHPHPYPFPRMGDVRLPGVSPGANPVSTGVTEVGSSRLHADRPEGATACYSMPSNGGIPCPASSPSPC